LFESKEVKRITDPKAGITYFLFFFINYLEFGVLGLRRFLFLLSIAFYLMSTALHPISVNIQYLLIALCPMSVDIEHLLVNIALLSIAIYLMSIALYPMSVDIKHLSTDIQFL
jgi:hypothetical protein